MSKDTTKSKLKFKTLATTAGKVKFLAVAKPRPAFKNRKDPETGEVIQEYSIRLELPNSALGKIDGGDATNLRDLIKTLQGEVGPKFDKIRKSSDETYELGFKSKRQPTVIVGTGELARTLTAEEIQSELGFFDSKTDSAEARLTVTLMYDPTSDELISMKLASVNIVSSNITQKTRKSDPILDLDNLTELYNKAK